MTVTFHDLKTAASAQFDKMAEFTLFSSSAGKDELWETYLGNFAEEDNPIYRENTVHDCNCCKQFIRAAGNVVAIIDNKLVSVWDIEIGGGYQHVVDALSALVKERGINSVFLHSEKDVGKNLSKELFEGKVLTYNHFHQVLPKKVVVKDGSIGTQKGSSMSNRAVLERSVTTLTDASVDVVLELIEQNSLYRGSEHLVTVNNLKKAKEAYAAAENKDLALWETSVKLGRFCSIRNTAIGSLLIDLSEELDLEVALKKFDKMTAPSNYKRSSKVNTKAMIQKAEKRSLELGIVPSFNRRYAVTSDITIDNVLFADRSAKEVMNVFSEMAKESAVKPDFGKVEEVSIEHFLTVVLPKAESLEIMMDSAHSRNLVSLIAPVNKDAEPILKWGNNFCWSYNGEIADSEMRENVKKAGGSTEGCLRFTIQWNEKSDNNIDFDAHCIEPNGHEIYHGVKNQRSRCSGMLDVDIITPGTKVAVENIVYSDLQKMDNGVYCLFVKNYSSHDRSKAGFKSEVEFEGVTHTFVYPKSLGPREKVVVAVIKLDENRKFVFAESLSSEPVSVEHWGIYTENFHKVDMVMRSPNHWDGEETGNKHVFFMLENCVNPERTRGFYNEFLRDELHEDRKVFEVLASKLKVENSNEQLSGLGFSSTLRNQAIVKVSGSFNRMLKINF
jgi:hypothetical protein